VCAPGTARADDGFQLNRYEPTPAGEFFFSAEHPWYSSTRYFAAGLTLDYSHNPLIWNSTNMAGMTSSTPIISDQMQMHVDLAGSFADRLQISATLPVTLFEGGKDFSGGPGSFGNLGDGVKPYSGVIGDPRIGLMLRLFGQPRTDPFTAHLGAYVWIPVGKTGSSMRATRTCASCPSWCSRASASGSAGR
jgi:hypothetical protein